MDRLDELFRKFYLKTASDAERRELAALIDAAGEQQLIQLMDAAAGWSVPGGMQLDERKTDEIADYIIGYRKAVEIPKPRIRFLRKWGWAAAVILLLGIAGVAVKITSKQPPLAKNEQQDVLPGTERATLTLADGSTIQLDSAANGTLARQGNTAVVKLANGQLTYQYSGTTADATATNTITTPRGGQYRLTLPDGTKVWINAATKVTYPVAFTGKDRRIKVTGEVYMEVAPDVSKPFLVEVGDQLQVQVLGTSFNINSYTDEPAIKTTLVDGSIRVVYAQEKRMLKPGEQAVAASSTINIRSGIDMSQVLAWKNGYFSFDNISLKEMARQIERWYDIKITFQGNVEDISLKGEMDRGVKLSGVVRFFNSYGLNARMDGNTLVLTGK